MLPNASKSLTLTFLNSSRTHRAPLQLSLCTLSQTVSKYYVCTQSHTHLNCQSSATFSSASARLSSALSSLSPGSSSSFATATGGSSDVLRSSSSAGVGIFMLNMGGPINTAEVEPFLHRLFSDNEIVQFGGGLKQQLLAKFISKRRTPSVSKQYESIGGGSQILQWTNSQGEQMCDLLNKLSPQTGPHTSFTCFRYSHPLTEAALLQLKSSGIRRVIAFSQYPQWSCTTSGSSLNHLWRELYRLKMEKDFQWSVIDRWYLHPLWIKANVQRIEEQIKKIPKHLKSEQILILFSAHSLPSPIVNRGDPYVTEVQATVSAVMQALHEKLSSTASSSSEQSFYRHLVSWQSQVGFVSWQGPRTIEMVENFGKQGIKALVVVPIAFVNDHLETLYELDLEVGHKAKESGIEYFLRSTAMNDSKIFYEALADIVIQHLKYCELKKEDGGKPYQSDLFPYSCVGCKNPQCRTIVNPVPPHEQYKRMIDR